jgi:L-asparaginase / beta-aspartyl-peptidase
VTDKHAKSGASPLGVHRLRFSFGILAHGGVGAPKTYSSGCKAACERGREMLEADSTAFEAVVEAVRILEDDGRFNAGSGSSLRLDGKTVEMDAAVMDCAGTIGSVIAIRDVKNPIVAARLVAETPHVALAGEGATLFAHGHGLPRSNGASPTSLRKYRRLMRLIKEGRLSEQDGRWNHQHLKQLWNFEVPYPDVFPSDTVGAVALDKQGKFAVAVSTGGASPMLLGRVGDVPFLGCGFYAGEAAAVAVTGIGEEIVRRMLSKTIYDKIAAGVGPKQACREGLALFSENVPIGIIALSKTESAIVNNRRMPSAQALFRGAL